MLSLRKGFEDLELFDRVSLNGLRDRGQMMIGRVFGEGSPYKERLSSISFRGGGKVAIVSSFGGSETPAERQRRERNWRSGQRESIALMDVMLEDLELSEFELPEPEWVEIEEDLNVQRSDRVFVVHGHDEG